MKSRTVKDFIKVDTKSRDSFISSTAFQIIYKKNHRLIDHIHNTCLEMEDHLVLRVDQLATNKSKSEDAPGLSPDASCSHASISVTDMKGDEEYDTAGEDEPLIQSIECRICQEEDTIKNLEVPCACSGSLKFAHRKCVQRWCNEKGDTICEICHQAYEPGYTAPPRSEDTVLDISASWTIGGTPIDLNDPRLLAMAAAERSLLDAEYEYEDTGANGASFCRSAALILMALLLLRHALTIGDGDDDDDDASAFFALFMLRAAGFLLPCYIMAWAISILQRRRQAQETERLTGLAAAADVAFMMQAGQHRGLQVTIAPGPGPAVAPSPMVTPPPPAVGATTTHGPLQ
ncbi:unnamed protein product [Lactuca virosa]|uniref:RING-CH-type domain-containing protein n=1 Tax=Lactuca virosa TaxID=75947 RepID=A0AAU9NYV0_9ASTR|nr:unnamed protein product [Lactuca virosa]